MWHPTKAEIAQLSIGFSIPKDVYIRAATLERNVKTGAGLNEEEIFFTKQYLIARLFPRSLIIHAFLSKTKLSPLQLNSNYF